MSLQFVHVLQSSAVQPLQEQLRLVPCLPVHDKYIQYTIHLCCSLLVDPTLLAPWPVSRPTGVTVRDYMWTEAKALVLTKHSTFNCDYEHMYKMYTREELFTTFKSFLVTVCKIFCQKYGEVVSRVLRGGRTWCHDSYRLAKFNWIPIMIEWKNIYMLA